MNVEQGQEVDGFEGAVSCRWATDAATVGEVDLHEAGNGGFGKGGDVFVRDVAVVLFADR